MAKGESDESCEPQNGEFAIRRVGVLLLLIWIEVEVCRWVELEVNRLLTRDRDEGK